MVGSQLEFDYAAATPREQAVRLEAHLVACGLSSLQARLAALVARDGRPAGDDQVMALTISSRRAAAVLVCSDRAVAKAAATLSHQEWFRVVEVGHRRPPTYVLDLVAARSVPTTRERLDELLGASGAPPPHLVGCEPLRTTAHRCEPVRTAARVLPGLEKQNPCPSSIFLPSIQGECEGDAASRCAPVRTGAQRAYVWSTRGGVTDAELRSAVARQNVELLQTMFNEAVAMGWIEGVSDERWMAFLTACHHAATARLARRMGRLVAFVKQGLDVSRTSQASDDWAGRMMGRQWRDPELAGRMMESTHGH